MEQTNLVITADGKTWDEVTRDTSYIGSLQLRGSHNTVYTAENSVNVFDEWRGNSDSIYALMNKDFAIAYDRVICLVAGEYQIYTHSVSGKDDSRQSTINVNGTTVLEGYRDTDNTQPNVTNTTVTLVLKRGDYVQVLGPTWSYNEWCSFEIRRM